MDSCLSVCVRARLFCLCHGFLFILLLILCLSGRAHICIYTIGSADRQNLVKLCLI